MTVDIIIIVLASIVLVPLVLFTGGAVRIVFGLIFVLFSPGYTLIASLFIRKTSLGPIERIALSFGLSIALMSLIGFALNYTSWGIRLNPVLICAGLFVLIMSGIAYYRRRKLIPEERFDPKLIKQILPIITGWKAEKRFSRILTVILVLTIIGTIGTLVYVVTNPRVGERFPELYILGTGGKAYVYPEELIVGQEGKVILGIANREKEPVTYRVEIQIDGVKVKEIDSIALNNDEVWEQEISFTSDTPGVKKKVEFFLYGSKTSKVYETHLWVSFKSP